VLPLAISQPDRFKESYSPMADKVALRGLIRGNVGAIATHINAALRGENVESMEHVLARVGRGSVVPHWYDQLIDLDRI